MQILSTKLPIESLRQAYILRNKPPDPNTHEGPFSPQMLRSDTVLLCNLIIEHQSCYYYARDLGDLGLVDLVDRNEGLDIQSRRFVDNVIWCEELERKLADLSKYLRKENNLPTEIEWSEIVAPDPADFSNLQADIETMHSRITQTNINLECLRHQLSELAEYIIVLKQIEATSMRRYFQRQSYDRLQTSIDSGSDLTGILVGTVEARQSSSLERCILRLCQGNVYCLFQHIDEPFEDPKTEELISKSVFIAYYRSEHLGKRLEKICDCFPSKLYFYPECGEERRKMILSLEIRVDEIKQVIVEGKLQNRELTNIIVKNLKIWEIKIYKIKCIYVALNKFFYDAIVRSFIAEFWCLEKDLLKIRSCIFKDKESSGRNGPAIMEKVVPKQPSPTHISTNKLSSPFQQIIHGYGVCRYQEINPAIFTVITFPFLFGIMFGDVGHALIMFFLTLVMILGEKKFAKYTKSSDMFDMIFGSRYMILMLSVFSLYCGFIYNDYFAIASRIGSSGWIIPSDLPANKTSGDDLFTLDPSTYAKSSPYMFGFDPIWYFSRNKMVFVNALKMKLSIILGVVHMLFGLTLSIFNHVHFNRKIYILLEFIPSMMYLLSCFGYLVFLIVYKWIAVDTFSLKKPSIMAIMINMFMNPLRSTPVELQLYPNQPIVEKVLLFFFVLSMPWLLLAKPIYLYITTRNQDQRYLAVDQQLLNSDGVMFPEDPSRIEDVESTNEAHNSFVEIMIEQLIHVIEFFLGCFSHSASYLRLWALSLAHGALSDVLWSLVLKRIFGFQFGFPGIFVTLLISFIWLVGTLGVVIGMEGLSAFLHALRLHWVEFQSKFFIGDGYLFVPYTLTPEE